MSFISKSQHRTRMLYGKYDPETGLSTIWEVRPDCEPKLIKQWDPNANFVPLSEDFRGCKNPCHPDNDPDWLN